MHRGFHGTCSIEVPRASGGESGAWEGEERRKKSAKAVSEGKASKAVTEGLGRTLT